MKIPTRLIPAALCVYCFAFCIPYGAAQADTAENTVLKLQGNPLKMTEYTGESFGRLTVSRIAFFDAGRIASEQRLSPDGTVHTTVTYDYTPEGLVSEIKGTDASGQLKWTYRYEYNEAGLLVTETSLDAAQTVEGTIVSEYTDAGLLSAQKTYNADGAVTLTETFSYTDAGRKTEQTALYGDGKILKRISFEYNDAGMPVKELRYDGNGLYETVVYTYIGKKIRSVTRFGADSVLKDTQYRTYSGELLSRTVTKNAAGEPVAEESFTYDRNGNTFCIRDATGVTIRDITYGD